MKIAPKIGSTIVVVGLPDTAVKESKDRVTTAIANSAFRWPRERTTINLAPADIKKEGPSFDLPIAIGMVAAALRVELPRLERCLVVGELALTGEIRPVKGALPIALEARNRGKKAVVLPSANAPEAAIVEGIDVYGVRNLREAYEFLSKQKDLLPVPGNAAERLAAARLDDVDFSEVKGQYQVKRAIEVSVAGGHNILLLCPNVPDFGMSLEISAVSNDIPQWPRNKPLDSKPQKSTIPALELL